MDKLKTFLQDEAVALKAANAIINKILKHCDYVVYSIDLKHLNITKEDVDELITRLKIFKKNSYKNSSVYVNIAGGIYHFSTMMFGFDGEKFKWKNAPEQIPETSYTSLKIVSKLLTMSPDPNWMSM